MPDRERRRHRRIRRCALRRRLRAGSDYALELCRRLGFETKLCENHRCGWAQIGAGETVVGILAHLDVVPAGSGWSHPAYDLSEENGRLYGRGVSDDKGPTIACIYAMKDILDAGLPLKRRVRIIFGQSEESGDWDDMAYYREHEELPVFGFTPDADFPAIYGEKRLLNYKLTMPLEESGLLDIRGGSASNVVPDHCEARLLIDGRESCITASGKASHASTPEDGENAIAALAAKLASLLPQSPFVRFYRDRIGSSLNGELMGCALSDVESGKLTMNVGTVGIADKSIVMEIDVRAPVTFEAAAVTEPLRRAAAEYGIEVALTQDTPPVYMDKNGAVIRKLLAVYREETGDCSEPTVIGGGTYARAMDHIVAFGPMFPGRELTEHQRNEYLLAEDFCRLRSIYRKAILALASD